MLCLFLVYSKVIQLYKHIYVSYIYKNVFQILFHFRLLQEVEYSFLCYTVEFCKQNNFILSKSRSHTIFGTYLCLKIFCFLSENHI